MDLLWVVNGRYWRVWLSVERIWMSNRSEMNVHKVEEGRPMDTNHMSRHGHKSGIQMERP